MKILWIPHTGWHIPQRAHLFCRALSEQHQVHVTDWDADFITFKDYLSTRYVKNYTYRQYQDGNIRVHGIPRISPTLYSRPLRRINTAIFSRYLRRIIQQHCIDVVVGNFLVPPPSAPRLVLDVCDDNPAYWREFRKNEAMSTEIEETEYKWAEKSCQIVVISSVLKDKFTYLLKSNLHTKIEIIPNGIVLDRFKNLSKRTVRNELGLGQRKIFGFISGMGEFSGLLRYIEAIRILDKPEVVHLIVGDGPLLNPAKTLAQKYGLDNVIFTGWIHSNKVTDYFAALDVGVIPFDLAEFTHSSFPIKLLEYLACNVLVVSTPLEEVMRLNFPGVYFADIDYVSFAKGLEQALVNDNKPPTIDLSMYDSKILVKDYESILMG